MQDVKYAFGSENQGAYIKQESSSSAEVLTFTSLRSRLVKLINWRISNGEYTERGIARLTGISQPQVHNVLKGNRNLTPETADVLLARLGVTLLDLITLEETLAHLAKSGISFPAKSNRVSGAERSE